ncbi:MAG: MFS transporter [Desulfobacteraceae bacterium]|nr:MAG: MFS transporter [Desulfobacteraceae bacterium]
MKDADSTSSSKISALIVAASSSFLTPFTISSVNIALPSIEREFRINALLLSWIATSYLLSAAIFLLPFGKLGDIYGRKRIFRYGIIIFTFSSFLAAFSSSAFLLIFSRIIQGFGSAMIFATGIAIISSVFPPEERGKALGITVAAVYSGLSCGPFFGGFLTQNFTWRSIFVVNVPLGILIILLIVFKLKGEWADAKGEKFDIKGSVIYGLSLIALMCGVTLLPDLSGFVLIIAGLSGLVLFYKWERKIRYPVFDVNLFGTNRVFAFSCLAALINYSATFSVTFLTSLFLQYIKGFSPGDAGMILMSQPVVMALFSPVAGRLSDRIEPRIIASIGMAITVSGLIFLSMIRESTGIVLIVSCLMLLGFGFALFSSPNMNAIMGSVERKFYGIASGSVGTMRLLGQMLSMGIVTLIFALLIGRVQITNEYHSVFITSYRLALVIFSVLCTVGVFLSLSRGKLRENN